MTKKTEKQDKKNKQEKKCKQCEEYLNGWKRAQADYENLKKTSILEKEEFAKFANLNLIISLIPVYNNFKISFEHLPEEIKDNKWVEGVIHIENQFKTVLEQNGVKEINPEVGEEFNPELHEAVETTNDKQQDDNTTKEKIEKTISVGYELKGKVFLPAKVIVK